MGGDASVDDGADRVAGHERAVVAALVVGALRVVGLQRPVGVEHPHLVGLRGDLADLFAVAGLAVLAVALPACLRIVGDVVVGAGGLGRLGHVERVPAGRGPDDVRLDDALARLAVIDRNLGLDGLAVLVGHGDLGRVVRFGAADHDLLRAHVDGVVQPEMLRGGAVRLDVRGVEAAGRDLTVRGRDLSAGRIGQRLGGRRELRRGPLLVRVLVAVQGHGVLHPALLGEAHVEREPAGRPALPGGVHVLVGEGHVLARLVAYGELLAGLAGGAVDACPTQGAGAGQVLADRAAVAAGGDRVGHIARVAGLGGGAVRLGGHAQVVVHGRFGLVEHDRDDRDRRLAHLARGQSINGGHTVIKARCGRVLGALVGVGVVRDAGRIVGGLPYVGVEGAVGAGVVVASAAGRVDEAEADEAALGAAQSFGLGAVRAFRVRLVQRLVDRLVGLRDAEVPHADAGHRGDGVLAGGRAPGVLVDPADLAGADAGAAAGAGPGSRAALAGVRHARGEQRRRGDDAGDQGPEPAALLVVLFGNQCSLSFQGFLSCGSPRRCRRGGTWGTRVPPVRRGAGPSGCSTRAGADNMRYRARPVHAHHGTTVRGASVWTSAGDGKGPATDAAGP